MGHLGIRDKRKVAEALRSLLEEKKFCTVAITESPIMPQRRCRRSLRTIHSRGAEISKSKNGLLNLIWT